MRGGVLEEFLLEEDGMLDNYKRRMDFVKALDALMREKAFEKVTVADLCSETGCSRPTFYRCFQDKYDIPRWFLRLQFVRFLSETGRALTLYDANLLMSHALLKNKSFFENAYRVRDPLSIRYYGPEMVVENLLETLTQWKGISVTQELLFQVQWYAVASTQMVMRWVDEGMEMSPEELAGYMDRATPSPLRELIDGGVSQSPTP